MKQTSMRAVGFHCDYHEDTDLLFAWIGAPERAINVEVEPGLYVRLDTNVQRAIGIEVLDCAARFNMKPADIDSAFAQTLLKTLEPTAIQMASAEGSSPHLPYASPQ